MQFKKALSYNIFLKAINVVLLFFSNVFFVRIIGADITGNFFYSITILSFITLLISLSLESGITFYGSKQTGNLESYAWFIILFSILQIGICACIISLMFNSQTVLPSHFLLMFVISNILISNFTALYFIQKWFITVNTVIIIINLLALLIFAYLLMNSDSNSIVIAQQVYISSFSVQAIFLIVLFFIKNRFQGITIPPANAIKKIFKYSLVALIGNISFFLVTRLDYVFVKQYCSAEALGNYVQVSKLGQLFILIPTMAASVIFPFTSLNKEDILTKVHWLCRLMTTIIVVAAVFLIVFGKWLFPIIFGHDFNLMYLAMLFYLPGIFSLCISSLLASYISGKGHIITNVIASVIALIVVIAGDIILIPLLGINAAAAISSVSYTFCLLYLLNHFKRIYNTTTSDLFRIQFTEVKSIFHLLKNKTNN